MVQSRAMYLALRRLGKKTILLAYPNEGHTLGKPENQIDLTNRIASWFDYYLKDEGPAEWIVKGTAKTTNFFR
jgi:dipeptidyl aminopeptidase/acylaminoacyl peptidase